MPASKTKSWPDIALDAWMFGTDASMVIWMRSMRFAMGGKAAEIEAQRMISEKFSAGMGFLPAMMQGGASQSAEAMAGRALSHYHKPVKANRRRLSR